MPATAEGVGAVLSGSEGEPVEVLVLGDDSANLRSEWVHQWGETQASQRPVSVVHWNESDDTQYNDPDVLSEDGDGAPLTLWSASREGADIASAIGRLTLFVPGDDDVDLVVFSLGANDSASAVPSQLDVLREETEERLPDVPIVVVLQGLDVVEPDVEQAYATWAEENDIPVWDARGAGSAQEWAELVDASVGTT